MSLTSFLKNKEVKEAFRREFKKPRSTLRAQLLAPPLTNHYGLVGTAFDYLLRFYVKRLSPDVIEKRWVSETSLHLLLSAQFYNLFGTPAKQPFKQQLIEMFIRNPLLSDNRVFKKVSEIIKFAKNAYHKFIETGKMELNIFKAALLLAQVDLIYRVGIVDENLGRVDENDIADLQNLISIVKPEYFKANKVCILNPTFGKASSLVGGADCDLVIDDTIIEVKTTKRLKFVRDYFDQLVGYYILYQIGGIDGLPEGVQIKRLGVYFSRYAYLHYINVEDVIKQETFWPFVEWFKKQAIEKYGTFVDYTDG